VSRNSTFGGTKSSIAFWFSGVSRTVTWSMTRPGLFVRGTRVTSTVQRTPHRLTVSPARASRTDSAG